MDSDSPDIAQLIKQAITMMMDRVMDRVLYKDPFVAETHRAHRPIYAALVPDEIFRDSHFERRFVTPFGKVWEKLASVVGNAQFSRCEVNHNVVGTVPEGRLRRIQEILNRLEHPDASGHRTSPNWTAELSYIMSGRGELKPCTVTCDLWVEAADSGRRFAFELKGPMPNSDQTKVSKEKIFKLMAMVEAPVEAAFFALPYNPYGKKDDYVWSFPGRWFDMKHDPCVLIGREFWDFIGGCGTYEEFIRIVNQLGAHYKRRIYEEYLHVSAPDNLNDFTLK